MENAGIEIAERFLASFDGTIELIAKCPSIGRLRAFLSPGLAGVRSKTTLKPFSVHLVFYRFDKGEISIERVLHGARDLEHHLSN